MSEVCFIICFMLWDMTRIYQKYVWTGFVLYLFLTIQKVYLTVRVLIFFFPFDIRVEVALFNACALRCLKCWTRRSVFDCTGTDLNCFGLDPVGTICLAGTSFLSTLELHFDFFVKLLRNVLIALSTATLRGFE